MIAGNTKTSDREIVIERVLNAPPDVVCNAFLDAEQIGLWWGPTGFDITTKRFDARPGGRWTFVMHGPDGVDYPNEIEFRTIDPPHRLVFAHVQPDGSDFFETTVRFVEENGNTRVTFRALFQSTAALEQVVRDHGADRGALQHLAHLASYIEAVTEPSRAALEIVNRRVFDAPVARVFDAFADPAKLAQWFGPDGFTNTFHQCDFREGGSWHYTMHAPNGTDFVNESVFLDIVPDARVVIDHLRPMHRFTLTIVMDQHEGKTSVVWRQAFATAAEVEAIREFLFEANEQNLGRLAGVLAATA